jgi:hypothetical protein
MVIFLFIHHLPFTGIAPVGEREFENETNSAVTRPKLKIDSVTVAKGIAIPLVVIGHYTLAGLQLYWEQMRNVRKHLPKDVNMLG